MGSKERNGSRKRDNPVRKRPPRSGFYFFLGGILHKHLHIDKGGDIITAWNYSEHKRSAYPWSETKKRMTPAYKTGQVVEMLNRSRVSLQHAITRGDIRKPVQSYTLDERRKLGAFYWNDTLIMEARDFFAVQHQGFPRKDGLISAKAIPTRAELRAMMEHGVVTYVKTSNGEFIPTFKEIVW